MCMHMCTRETGGKEKKKNRENRIKGREKEGHIQPKGGMGGRHAATTTTQARGFSREGRWVASRRPPFAWASKEGKENRPPKERKKEKQTAQTRDGTRIGSPPARALEQDWLEQDFGRTIRDTGEREWGAHRDTEGGWAGFTHTTVSQGFLSRIGRVAPGGTGAGAGLLLVALS